MSEHEELRQLAALHGLEALDAEDAPRVESHLADGCADCEAAFLDARRVGDALARWVEPVAPPAEIRQELRARVRADLGARATRTRALLRPTRPLALAASLALLVVGGYAALLTTDYLAERERSTRLAGELASERALAERRLAELRARASEDARQLAALQETLDGLGRPESRAVALAGTESAPGASARAFVDAEHQSLLLLVHGLPPLRAGRTYQLWVIVGGQPVSAGIFGVGPDGAGRFRGAELTELEAGVTLAVTEEPAGGMPQPTGPVLLVGS